MQDHFLAYAACQRRIHLSNMDFQLNISTLPTLGTNMYVYVYMCVYLH